MTHTMFVNQTHTKTNRETFWATDTGLSPHTLTLKTLGQIAGDVYHARRLDACANKEGRRSGRRIHVCSRTRLATDVCFCPQDKHGQTSRKILGLVCTGSASSFRTILRGTDAHVNTNSRKHMGWTRMLVGPSQAPKPRGLRNAGFYRRLLRSL